MKQSFIFSFERAHDNEVSLKYCHHFSFASNKSISQKIILFMLSSTRVTGDPKIISVTTNATDMGLTLKYFTSKISKDFLISCAFKRVNALSRNTLSTNVILFKSLKST